MFRILLWVLAVYPAFVTGQGVPSPEAHFGFRIGEDYRLANYTQTAAYFAKVAAASDRVRLVSIGKTEEGRDQPMLIVTSPENHKNLERYRQIAVKMARAEGISEEEAKTRSREGKAVVWIDGGLHATETVGMQQLIASVWAFASQNDPETLHILDKVIILFVHANPDGQELVSDWYMREKEPHRRSLQHLPRLYQKYAGHDNNRDFYMQNLKESQNMGRQLFIEWIPQIMYNHHQRGPAGAVLAGPPYRDPFNYVFDPLMVTGIDALGAAMYNRLNAENKPGYTRMDGSVFSTWYNGGLRTTTHFHNMIGLLTEIIGGPAPEDIPLVPDRLLPDNNTPHPVAPQRWHFGQSIEYSLSLNYAVLDYAARHSDQLLYNIYRMGRNSIERGSRDYWTPYPRRIESLKKAYLDEHKTSAGKVREGERIPAKYYETVFRDPLLRDPRGYVIPADQADFSTAVKFVNALIRTGIKVEKATAAFEAGNTRYPAGSFVVKTAQAFRPHILDMFEPQNYPNDFRYPGGPPVAPYDAAGWTLAYQMGIRFDRMLDDFSGPFETLPYGALQSVSGGGAKGQGDYILKGDANDSFGLVNRLLKEGVAVYRTVEKEDSLAAGTFVIRASGKSRETVERQAAALGVPLKALRRKVRSGKVLLRNPLRIGLWDTYGGSMSSGWIRWLLEQYGFDFKTIFPAEIDSVDLKANFDVLIFPTQAVPAPGADSKVPDSREGQVPAAYRHMLGRVNGEVSVPRLRRFLEDGGKIIAIGTSTNLAYHLKLPVRNALTELTNEGTPKRLPPEKYYVPGSILRVNLDTTVRANNGLGPLADVYFDNSPVFHLAPDAVAAGLLRPLAWFGERPLRSGWAWGEAYLKEGVAAFEAPVGKGYLYAFGPEITFRAQSHGTFRWLFNQLY